MFEVADDEDWNETDEDCLSDDVEEVLWPELADPDAIAHACCSDCSEDGESDVWDLDPQESFDMHSEAYRSHVGPVRSLSGRVEKVFVAPLRFGNISQDLILPTELCLNIVDMLAQQDILSIARLASSCKRWHQLVNEDAQWEARAKALGATEMQTGTSWQNTWLAQYLTTCRYCKAAAGMQQNVPMYLQRYPYLHGEPRNISICSFCMPYRQVYAHSSSCDAFLLSGSEIEKLADYREGVGRFWVSTQIEGYRNTKIERRSAEIDELLAGRSQAQKDIFRMPEISNIVYSGHASAVERAVGSIWTAADAPRYEDMEGIFDLQSRFDGMHDLVAAYVQSQPNLNKAKVLTLIEKGLQWLCSGSKGVSSDRTTMHRWRSELASGDQTIARFVQELQNPTISHSAENCKGNCGRTPALACSQEKCARCCTGSGCERHANKKSYAPRRNYLDYDHEDRYAYYGHHDYW